MQARAEAEAAEPEAESETEAEEPAAAEPETLVAEPEEPAAAEPEPVVAESEEPAAAEPETVVAEPEEPAAAEPETVVAESEEKSTISKEEGELRALRELGNLQALANEHEDTTQEEIKALENALAKGDSRLDRLREAGKRLSAKVKLEFRALLKREEKLLSNIEESRHKIEEVEKEPETEEPPKVVKELKVLEDLADDYKATTADEIKALEALAKAIK